MMRMRGIISFKNPVNLNKNLIGNITEELKKKFTFVDIVVNDLNTPTATLRWVRYLHQSNR